MRGKYYINITRRFLYFHLPLCLQVLCTNIIINIYAPSVHYVPLNIYFVVVQMNSIQSNEYT